MKTNTLKIQLKIKKQQMIQEDKKSNHNTLWVDKKKQKISIMLLGVFHLNLLIHMMNQTLVLGKR